MSLTLSLELPPYVRAVWSDDGKTHDPAPEGVALWSPPKGDDRAPPALGDLIMVGRWGAAVVTAYFVEGEWLGVRASLLAPSADWFRGRKPGSEHDLCVFAPEFIPCEPPATPTPVTLTWRDHPHGPAFRCYNFPAEAADWRAFATLLESVGFKYDGRHAAQVADKYQFGAPNAYALAARLRFAGYAVTHAGCYGDDGPPSDGLRKWWKD